MRKREIHSIAHWVIMTLLLTFPILMVGISTFGKESQTIDVTETYEYETNEVNSVDDLVQGNIYKCTIANPSLLQYQDRWFNCTSIYNLRNDVQTYNYEISVFHNTTSYLNLGLNSAYTTLQVLATTSNNSYLGFVVGVDSTISQEFYFVYYNNFKSDLISYISASDYLGEKNVDYVIHNEDYKQDVNNWINGFLNLPINAWYQSLMNVIGVGFTNSTVMNVIYVMPVYIIWVFIFDLVVDCFLVLIRLPHKLLNRLSGGENE